MRLNRLVVLAALNLAFALSLTPPAMGQLGNDFTYQGELRDGGTPVDGTVSATFRLYDQLVGGSQIGPANVFNSLAITDGLFTVTLDFFTPAFAGSPRWLEIEIDGEILTPRQPVLPTPYSLFSNHTRGLTVDSSEDVAIGTNSTLYKFQVFADVNSRAIYGNHFSTAAGENYGVYGRSNGPDGIGVFGLHDNSSGTNAGVRGETDSTSSSAVGVHGVVNSTSPGSFSAAVRGENLGAGSSGIGVWGSHEGNGWGVYGTSPGGLGRAVYGQITGSGGFAGYFLNNSGVAVLADGADNTGSIAALEVVSGAQTMFIDGNEIDSNASVGLFLNNNNANNVILGTGGGFVGIGTSAPTNAALHVSDAAASVFSPVRIEREVSNGTLVAWYEADAFIGSIFTSGGQITYGTFTGAHYCHTGSDLEPGMLVRLTGGNERLIADRPESEVIYGIEPTTRANDPSCLGAYLGRESKRPDPSRPNPHTVAAVGNGEMWVTQQREFQIGPGDFLISSDVPGCAMRDDPERFEIGYVIARAAEPLEWAQVRADETGVKRAKISVLFESFVRDSRGAALAEVVRSQQAQIDSLREELTQMRQALAALQATQGE